MDCLHYTTNQARLSSELIAIYKNDLLGIVDAQTVLPARRVRAFMTISKPAEQYCYQIAAAVAIGRHACPLDQNNVDLLNQGGMPIQEPGLEQVVARNRAAAGLRFSTDVAASVQHGDLQFIAVGTPPDEDGSADLQYVLAASRHRRAGSAGDTTRAGRARRRCPMALRCAASCSPFGACPSSPIPTICAKRRRGAVVDAEALVIVTEWKAFRSPDFERLKANLKQAVIFDGRNLFEPETMVAAGIGYHSIGRSALNGNGK